MEHVKKTLNPDDPITRSKTRNEMQDIRREKSAYADWMYRPPPNPTEIPTQIVPWKTWDWDIASLEQDMNIDFEENSPHQEGEISEIYQRWDKSYFQEPPELQSQVDTGNVGQTFLPKQADIDRILKIIQRNVLKGTHLPVTVKEIQAGYLISPYFKDLYSFLAQNKLPNTKSAIRKVEMLAIKIFTLLHLLLFKLVTTPEKDTALLAIPEICADKIITLYHSSLFAGYQDVIKTYFTIGDKFFIPGLIHHLRSYIKGCHICQLSRNEKPLVRQLQQELI